MKKKEKNLTINDPVYSGREFQKIWDYILSHGSNFDRFFEGVEYPRERILDENEWIDIRTTLKIWDNYRSCLPDYDMTQSESIGFYATTRSSFGIARLIAQFTSIKTIFRIFPFLGSMVSRIDLFRILELKRDNAVIEYYPYPGFEKFIDSSFAFSILGTLKAIPVTHNMPPADVRESASLINVFNKFRIDFARFDHKIEEREGIIYLDDEPAGRWILISDDLDLPPAVCKYLPGEKCVLWEKDVIEKKKSGRDAVVARKGDLYNCSKSIFTVRWENPGFSKAMRNITSTLRQSLFSFLKSRESILGQSSRLRNQARILQQRIDEKTSELETAYKKIAQMEKRSMEHGITGGFAHEMRNALTGAQLELRVLEKEDSCLDALDHNITSLASHLEKTIDEFNIPENDARTCFYEPLTHLNKIKKSLSTVSSNVSNDINKGLAITRQIRNYTKIHNFSPGHDLVDLSEFLKSYQFRFQEKFERSGITYTVTGMNGPIFKANHEHLDSIFFNLILNAQQALMEQEQSKGQQRIQVNLSVDAPWIKISVKDNGPGIENRHRLDIFNPFFSTKSNGGAGLGLSIVQRLVELYGGTIDFKTQKNQGTAFEICFPMD